MTGGGRRGGDPPGEEDQERRLQRERVEADPAEQDAATGPGYTARPSGEGPEDDEEKGSGGTA